MVQGCYASQPRSTEYSPPSKVDTKHNEETTVKVAGQASIPRGRLRAILAYEISWFLFDFPVISPWFPSNMTSYVVKVGGAGGLGWFPSLISRKFALISHDFNLISTDFSTRCTRFLSWLTPRSIPIFEACTGPNRCFFTVFHVQQMQSFSS